MLASAVRSSPQHVEREREQLNRDEGRQQLTGLRHQRRAQYGEDDQGVVLARVSHLPANVVNGHQDDGEARACEEGLEDERVAIDEDQLLVDERICIALRGQRDHEDKNQTRHSRRGGDDVASLLLAGREKHVNQQDQEPGTSEDELRDKQREVDSHRLRPQSRENRIDAGAYHP